MNPGFARMARCASVVVASVALGTTLAVGTASADPHAAYIGPQENNAQQGAIGSANRGTEVQCVQEALGIRTDGVFGQQTYDAVRAFQREKGIQVDGIVGPQTGDLILLKLGYTARLYSCYPLVPTTYAIDPNDGAVPTGDSPIECLLQQPNNIRKDLVKIFGGKSNLAHVVKATGGRGLSTAFGLVKCTFAG